MSRGLGWFLTFCVGLAVVGVVTAVWIGPRFALFALDSERRQAPVQLLDFVRLTDSYDVAEYRRNFIQPLEAKIRELEGQTLWRGTVDIVAAGTTADEWDLVSLTAFPRGSVFIDMVTSPEYREREERAERVRLGTMSYLVEDALPDVDAELLAAYIVAVPEHGAGTGAVDGLGAVVDRYNGREAFRSRLTRLTDSGPVDWNMLVAYEFGSDEELASWLGDPERQTAVSLAKPDLAAHRLLVIRRT